MIGIPRQLESEFEGWLRKKALPNGTHWVYKKWLRYYLDFCHKYGFPHAQRECLSPFLRKLQEKRQTKFQQDRFVGMRCPVISTLLSFHRKDKQTNVNRV